MIEEWLLRLTAVVVPIINLMALAVICLGTLHAVFNGLRAMVSGTGNAARAAWAGYSRWRIAGLTFPLAADIIDTSAAPSWTDIGQLAAIAAIRTFLNYFLERDYAEIEERERRYEERAAVRPQSAD